MTTTLTRAAAVPLAFSHAWTAWSLGLALALAALTINPAPAHAGVIGETAEHFAKELTDDPVAQKEIGEAVETLIESAPDAREIVKHGPGAKGGPKGVSGPFQELVVNFDKMACAAWIISFRNTLLGLMLKRDPETPPETIRAAQNLLNKVVFACRKVFDDEELYEVGGGGVTGGGGSGVGTAGGNSGPGATQVDGEWVLSASDRICWNRCADKWAGWKNAEAMRQRAEQRMREARDEAAALERTGIPDSESRLAELERAYAKSWGNTPPTGHAGAQLANLRTEVAQRRAEVRQLRQEADALQQALDGLSQAEQDALKAYLDCMKACADQARAAGSPSTFADRTIEVLTPRLQIGMLLPVRPVREETVQLEAIMPLRTGTANMSGTEVSLALPFGRDLASQTRADAASAMELARSDHFEHGQHPAQPAGSEPATSVPEPTYVTPPAEVVQDAPAPQEFIEFQPPVEVRSPGEFYCPDHPGMGPHSH